jgi:hypothetical protein
MPRETPYSIDGLGVEVDALKADFGEIKKDIAGLRSALTKASMPKRGAPKVTIENGSRQVQTSRSPMPCAIRADDECRGG